jgi:hypothetical protein
MESTIKIKIKANNALELQQKTNAINAFANLDNDTSLKVSKIICSPNATKLLKDFWLLIKMKL